MPQSQNCDLDFQRLGDWIFDKKSILLLTHQRPDGDAIGSVIGLSDALTNSGIKCIAYIDNHLPARYKDLVPKDILTPPPTDFGSCDSVICLDTANEERLGIPDNLTYHNLLGFPCCNIDHHVDNSRYGEITFINSNSAATAEILATFAKTFPVNLTPISATMFLMGIITDTGGFRFDNTTAITLETAAWLVKNGGDYSRLMQKMYFEEPAAKLKLSAKLYENMKFAFSNRVAYFFLTPELLTLYEVDEKDTEDLVDIARVIKGVEIACRMQKVSDGVRFSIRSNNENIPVNEMARELGGGGHKMAAGAFIRNVDLERGEKIFLNCAKKIFHQA